LVEGRSGRGILLSFAQCQREVIGEFIRDKFASSRARSHGSRGMSQATSITVHVPLNVQRRGGAGGRLL
jgi:hypothetical protein